MLPIVVGPKRVLSKLDRANSESPRSQGGVWRCLASTVLLALAILGMIGCDDQAKKAKRTEIEPENLPPLRVVLVGPQEVGSAIEARWKSNSSQSLDISYKTEDEFLELEKCRVDVVIFPNRLLSDVVERGWISPFRPKKVDDSGEFAWSSHWSRTTMYGKASWGIPLGVSIPAVFRSASDESRDRPWDWKTLQGSTPASAPNSNETVNAESPLTHEQEVAIVDRFLMVVGSRIRTSPNISALFNPLDMRSKLLTQPIVESVMEFASLAKSNPSMLMSHEEAWRMVRDGKSTWAVGYPDRNAANESESQSFEVGLVPGAPFPGEVAQIGLAAKCIVESGNGWIASRATATRQSATANLFLEWLNQEEQRESLSSMTTAVVPRPMGLSTLSAGRPELAAYYRMVSEAWTQNGILMEFNLRGSSRYRSALARALAKISQDPSKTPEYLKECHQDWETITEKLGRGGQKQSLERGLQLLEVENR